MDIDKLQMYKVSMELGERIWKYVLQMDPFSKETIGNQIVRSSDSIVANISEGEGVFHFGDKNRYLYYSRGSLFETKTWIYKMKNRKLIDETMFLDLIDKLELTRKLINGSISKLPKNAK